MNNASSLLYRTRNNWDVSQPNELSTKDTMDHISSGMLGSYSTTRAWIAAGRPVAKKEEKATTSGSMLTGGTGGVPVGATLKKALLSDTYKSSTSEEAKAFAELPDALIQGIFNSSGLELSDIVGKKIDANVLNKLSSGDAIGARYTKRSEIKGQSTLLALDDNPYGFYREITPSYRITGLDTYSAYIKKLLNEVGGYANVIPSESKVTAKSTTQIGQPTTQLGLLAYLGNDTLLGG